jgi:hypothetical protein
VMRKLHVDGRFRPSRDEELRPPAAAREDPDIDAQAVGDADGRGARPRRRCPRGPRSHTTSVASTRAIERIEVTALLAVYAECGRIRRAKFSAPGLRSGGVCGLLPEATSSYLVRHPSLARSAG